MRKSTRIGKRLIALFLVLLLSIESFAATVGDNDGAAFITKAEFDSLKNTFQAQIDQYNSSIDNKIDGAIAGYLAGISVAKQYDIKPYVSNYNDMMWVNKYQIYGKWRKWTSNTSKTESTTNVWYVPELNEKRLLTRSGNGLTLYDPLYASDGYGVLVTDLTYIEYKNGFSLGKRNYGSDASNPSAPPVAFVWLDYNESDRQYYPNTGNPLNNAATLMNVQHFMPHNISDGGDWYLNRGWPVFFDYSYDPPISFGAASSNQVYNITLRWGMDYNSYRKQSASRPTFAHFLWPNLFTWGSLFNGTSWATEFDLNASGQLDGQGTTDSSYYARGVTFNLGDSATATTQNGYFLKMMLGKDTDQKVNAGYLSTKGSSQTFDFSTTDDKGQIKVKLNRAQLSQPQFTDKSQDGLRAGQSYWPTSDIEFELNLPLWPTLKMQDINSNYYQYNKQPLKKGAGLPIAIDAPAIGALHVSGKYETKRIISTYSSKGISIDVSNDTFIADDWKYLKGYDSNVDPDKTTASEKELKNITYNNTAKTFELTIPVKRGDNVWLRVAPDTTDGGYYAQISDLKVTLISQ